MYKNGEVLGRLGGEPVNQAHSPWFYESALSSFFLLKIILFISNGYTWSRKFL